MADDVPQLSGASAAYATNQFVKWKRLQGGDDFKYPIDYWIAPLGMNRALGRAEFLVKWEPNSYCHYHRHTGSTMILVLEGEHHVIETTPTETIHKTRRPGHFTRNPPGDLHMEHGGPNGSVLFFSMEAPDGRLFDILADDGTVLRSLTVEDLETGNY